MLAHGIAHMVVLALLAVGTVLVALRRPRAAKGIAAAVLLVGIPAQLAAGKWPWLLANATGWSDVVLWSELWIHLAVVLGIAAVMSQPSEPASPRGARRRTVVLAAVLVGAAGAATSFPPLDPPALQPAWVDDQGVVRQSAPSSCAAAAVATLLRRLGIDPHASEAELAARCLTDPWRGTRDLGIYRGLARSAPGRSVRFAWPGEDGLRARRTACMAFVGLRPGCTPDAELYALLRERCGWAEGELHAVVLNGIEPSQQGERHEGEAPEVAVVDDPRYGRERWSLEHWRALWTGMVVVID